MCYPHVRIEKRCSGEGSGQKTRGSHRCEQVAPGDRAVQTRWMKAVGVKGALGSGTVLALARGVGSILCGSAYQMLTDRYRTRLSTGLLAAAVDSGAD